MNWSEKWKMNAAPDLSCGISWQWGWVEIWGVDLAGWPNDPKLIELNLILYLFRFVLVSGSLPASLLPTGGHVKMGLSCKSWFYGTLIMEPKKWGCWKDSIAKLFVCLVNEAVLCAKWGDCLWMIMRIHFKSGLLWSKNLNYLPSISVG